MIKLIDNRVCKEEKLYVENGDMFVIAGDKYLVSPISRSRSQLVNVDGFHDGSVWSEPFNALVGIKWLAQNMFDDYAWQYIPRKKVNITIEITD